MSVGSFHGDVKGGWGIEKERSLVPVTLTISYLDLTNVWGLEVEIPA